MRADGPENTRTEDLHNTSLPRYICACSVSIQITYILLCLFALQPQSFCEAKASAAPH
jgi:hypothetical protein